MTRDITKRSNGLSVVSNAILIGLIKYVLRVEQQKHSLEQQLKEHVQGIGEIDWTSFEVSLQIMEEIKK